MWQAHPSHRVEFEWNKNKITEIDFKSLAMLSESYGITSQELALSEMDSDHLGQNKQPKHFVQVTKKIFLNNDGLT